MRCKGCNATMGWFANTMKMICPKCGRIEKVRRIEKV